MPVTVIFILVVITIMFANRLGMKRDERPRGILIDVFTLPMQGLLLFLQPKAKRRRGMMRQISRMQVGFVSYLLNSSSRARI